MQKLLKEIQSIMQKIKGKMLRITTKIMYKDIKGLNIQKLRIEMK